MFDWSNFVMNDNAGFTNQKDNAIPIRYQLSGPDFMGIQEEVKTDLITGNKSSIGDNYRNTSLQYQVATRAYPGMSPYFRDNFNIVRSFERTLDPNDIWNFEHTHHFGAGIDIAEMCQAFLSMNQLKGGSDTPSYLRLGNDRPLVGFWLVESQGVPCTCLIADKTNLGTEPTFQNPYAGTSNGSYHCEFRSSLSYVTPLLNAAAAQTTSTAGAAENIHMRVFKKRDFILIDSRVVRHVLPENMVIDKDDLLEDKGMITIYTEATAQSSAKKEYRS